MGCFSISCCASNLPIYNHRIALLILREAKYPTELTKNFICSNNGASAFYEPVGPMIYGVCDTYGNIEEIEDTSEFRWNCELLNIEPTETAFHEWVEKDWMKTSDYTLTFFLRDIVDGIVDYTNKAYSLFNYSHQHWLLERFPNIFSEKDQVEGRYNRIFQSRNGVLFASDSQWIHPLLEPNHGLYNTKSVLSYLNDESISKEILNYQPETTTEYELSVLKNKPLDFLETKFPRLYKRYYYDNQIDMFEFPSHIIKSLAQVYNLGYYMYACNKFFYPVVSGHQHNDYEALDHLNKMSSILIATELKEE